MSALQLNARAQIICDRLAERADELRLAVHRVEGARVIDLGCEVRGGLEAGRLFAEACMAGLGTVELTNARAELGVWPTVLVRTDQPTAACMASQYAGWQISREGFFAMGSGPMRAVAGKEALFEKIGCREQPEVLVGILESRRLPNEDVCRYIAETCRMPVDRLTLLVAPTASLACNVQVAARSIETAMHKLSELDFDLERIDSGVGVAPLPPPAKNDLAAIGRTNDAILYGAHVLLYVRGSLDELLAIGPKVPSRASSDYGASFSEIFDRYNRDFYKIDPALFSPASVTFVHLDSGRTFHFGDLAPDVLQRSFHQS